MIGVDDKQYGAVDEAINVVFDGPPGPTPGRFVEVETDDGRSVCVGEWIKRDDGLWALRIERHIERGVPDWTPSTGDYDRSIHSNPDHEAWADFFMQTFPNCGADRDTMAGWFANAMMAKHDSMPDSGVPDEDIVEPPHDVLQAALRRTGNVVSRGMSKAECKALDTNLKMVEQGLLNTEYEMAPQFREQLAGIVHDVRDSLRQHEQGE